MQGSGTDELALIRVIVARSEVDLEFVKEEYFRLFKRNLAGDIKVCAVAELDAFTVGHVWAAAARPSRARGRK